MRKHHLISEYLLEWDEAHIKSTIVGNYIDNLKIIITYAGTLKSKVRSLTNLGDMNLKRS